MAILRYSRIALTMEIYTQVPDKATRDALRRLSDSLGTDREREAHDLAQLRAEDDEPGEQAG
jgi:hypothetical protein